MLDSALPYLKRHAALILVLALTGVFMVGVRVHYNTLHYGTYHGDEYHTVHQGLNLIVNGKVENFRSQESVRWMVRFSYPYALIKMAENMGGNVWIDGWEYPGHAYVSEHFVNHYGAEASRYDPNLRDFLYYLRLPYVLMVACAVFFLSYVLLKKKYVFSAVMLPVALGLTAELVKEQRYFYIEPAMLALIAILTGIFFHALLERKRLTRTFVLGMSFTLAFLASTKISGAILILLPLALIFWNCGTWRERYRWAAWFFAGLPVFYILINFPALISLDGLNAFLHDFTSNFWQYAAGSNEAYTVAPGLPHLKLIFNQFEGVFGPAIYAAMLLPIAGLWLGTKQERRIVGTLTALVALAVLSMSRQHVYLSRNLLPFYIVVFFVVLFSAEILHRTLRRHPKTKNAIIPIYVLLAVVAAIGLAGNAGGIRQSAGQAFGTPKSLLMPLADDIRAESPERPIYRVGIDDGFFDGTSFGENGTELPHAPEPLHRENYPAYEALFAELPQDAMVFVRRTGNNKHVTNYILPKYFRKNQQRGEYYVFYNDIQQ